MAAITDPAVIEALNAEMVAKNGPWHAHVHLDPGLGILGEHKPGYDIQIPQFLDYVSYFSPKPFSQSTLLDLACHEGLYAIEAARRGAHMVTGIEGRRSNIAHGQLAADVLGLDNIRFIQDDVRNLSIERYGSFDITLALGILYHLGAPDCFEFLARIAEATRYVALIDTHIGLVPNIQVSWRGAVRLGTYYQEPIADGMSAEQVEALRLASIKNTSSFWIEEAALFRVLYEVGFDRVFRADLPLALHGTPDRVRLLAVKRAAKNSSISP
jgi:hypothetical protein